jgi:5-methylthioadenosine/S-adenosylhomocysteine deaminase
MRSDRIIPALAPHAPYTVAPENLLWIKEYADKKGLMIHMHLAETKKEIEDHRKQYGKNPVPHYEEIGVLGPNMIAAHSIWLDEKDISILAKYDVKISHNPVSNMKLCSGVLPYRGMKKAGLTVSLGTDGCGSNNDLDMFESMKFASLLQKHATGDPTALPAKEAYEMATVNGAKALGIDAGVIAKGKLADIILIDLKKPELTPDNNLTANLVYSAKGSCVDTVICDGRILMEGRRVDGEEEVIEKAEEAAKDLFGR